MKFWNFITFYDFYLFHPRIPKKYFLFIRGKQYVLKDKKAKIHTSLKE